MIKNYIQSNLTCCYPTEKKLSSDSRKVASAAPEPLQPPSLCNPRASAANASALQADKEKNHTLLNKLTSWRDRLVKFEKSSVSKERCGLNFRVSSEAFSTVASGTGDRSRFKVETNSSGTSGKPNSKSGNGSSENESRSASCDSLTSAGRVYRPPSLFSDSRELSVAECDRHQGATDSEGFNEQQFGNSEEQNIQKPDMKEELTVILNRIYEHQQNSYFDYSLNNSSGSKSQQQENQNLYASGSDKSSYSINV